MSTKIKVIPVLKGENSVYFNKTLRENVNKKVSDEDYNRIADTVNAVAENSPEMFGTKRMKRR